MTDTVLIVDDDASVQTMLYKIIKSNGINADTASSGETALEMIKKMCIRDRYEFLDESAMN